MIGISFLLLVFGILPAFLLKGNSSAAVTDFFPAMLFCCLAGIAEYLGCTGFVSWTIALVVTAVLVLIGIICLLTGMLKFNVRWYILQRISENPGEEEEKE